MSSLRDAVIDEVRWPRMFQTLRRAGLYRDCGCAGCGSCQAAARRFVLGVARGARRTRWTSVNDAPARRTIYGRAYGGRRFGFLVDGWPHPTILDLVAEPAPNDEAVEEHEGGLWATAIQKGRKWPDEAASKEWQKDIWPAHIWESDNGKKGVVTFADIEKVPKESGLYLIVWPHGAYLGMSKLSVDSSGRSNQGIYGRVARHRRAYEEFSWNKPSLGQKRLIRVYWLRTKPSVNLANVEGAYLKRILGEPLPASKTGKVERYQEKGFRNREELELQSAAE